MDIDLDFQPGFDIKDLIKSAIPASRVNKNHLVKHTVGHYFQEMPIDGQTGFAAIPYEEAEALGYFKIDFLPLNTLNNFVSKQEIRELIKHEPQWDLLLDEKQVVKLSQVSKQASLLKKIRPRSVQELADCLALPRPGKRHLIDSYSQKKNDLAYRTELYAKTADGYSFKRSHALAYALTIVLEMHLIAAGVL